MILQIGGVYEHPQHEVICITGGQYHGDNGCISNFWRWREVLEDGRLGRERSGHGGQWPEIANSFVEIRVILPQRCPHCKRPLKSFHVHVCGENGGTNLPLGSEEAKRLTRIT
jgi:hypothetical protein